MNKHQIREAKNRHRRQKHGGVIPHTVDCACVIHGSYYDWIYVERLYNMVTRHVPCPVRFHVWTEHDRSVPPHMIKHCLEEWPGISGPKRSWWYKMQMFDPKHHCGNLLYFDLDVIIVDDISWAVSESTEQFWTLRDFRYLQRPTYNGLNSSMMWWNVERFSWIWEKFCRAESINSAISRYPGDQDFLQATVTAADIRYFDTVRVSSWRWQCYDGGWDFQSRRARTPGSGTVVPPGTSVLVFHGRPKPHQIEDPAVAYLWAQGK